MSSTAEIKLANLLIALREGANTANQVADQIEKALLAMYEPEGAMPSSSQEPAQKTSTTTKKCNSNIASLIRGDKFQWDLSPSNIIDLKDYCFVEVVAKSDTNIGFKFISSSLGKVVITQNYDQDVYDSMKVGGIYVCHNVRKGRKLHWDNAIELLGYTKEQCISKAKSLARIFAEQK